jgi:hypothetical protein
MTQGIHDGAGLRRQGDQIIAYHAAASRDGIGQAGMQVLRGNARLIECIFDVGLRLGMAGHLGSPARVIRGMPPGYGLTVQGDRRGFYAAVRPALHCV